MTKKMTEWGVGPKIFRIFFPYLVLTAILHFSYPKTFVFTKTDSIVFPFIGILLILIGLIIWGSGARVISKAFEGGRLLTEGVYSIVRHPMYSGLIIFVSTGVALSFRSWIMLTVPLVGYIVFNSLIKEEENYLKERFGQEYLDYRSRVNALVPFPRFRSRPAAVVILIVLEVLLAFLGFASGFTFLLDPSGEAHDMDTTVLEGTPVGDFALVGLFFIVFFGILPSLATYGLWKLPRWRWTDPINKWTGQNWAWTATTATGAILILWIVVEIALIGSPNDFALFLQVMMTILGIVILALVMIPRVRTFMKLAN